MNTLSDTLRDLIKEVSVQSAYDMYKMQKWEEDNLVEEYLDRIKNELNVEKYLK